MVTDAEILATRLRQSNLAVGYCTGLLDLKAPLYGLGVGIEKKVLTSLNNPIIIRKS